jgi:hypothetical protein
MHFEQDSEVRAHVAWTQNRIKLLHTSLEVCWNYMYHPRIILSVVGSVWYMVRNHRCTVTIDSVLANSKTQNALLSPVHAMFRHDCTLAVKPAITPQRPLPKQTRTDSLPIDMLHSAVSVLVVAQSSSEFRRDLWITLYKLLPYSCWHPMNNKNVTLSAMLWAWRNYNSSLESDFIVDRPWWNAVENSRQRTRSLLMRNTAVFNPLNGFTHRGSSSHFLTHAQKVHHFFFSNYRVNKSGPLSLPQLPLFDLSRLIAFTSRHM